MKALLIIGIILGVLLLLTLPYVKLYVKAADGNVTFWAGILFLKFQLYPQKEKKEKKKREKTKKAFENIGQSAPDKAVSEPRAPSVKQESAKPSAASSVGAQGEKRAQKPMGPEAPRQQKAEHQEKRDVKEIIALVYDLIRLLVKPTRFMLRNIKITNLRLRVVVGGEEPDETAIQFGRWNAAVYGGLAALRNFMTVRCRKILIAVDFTEPETKLWAEGVVKIRILVLLIAVVRILKGILVNTLYRAKEDGVAAADKTEARIKAVNPSR